MLETLNKQKYYNKYSLADHLRFVQTNVSLKDFIGFNTIWNGTPGNLKFRYGGKKNSILLIILLCWIILQSSFIRAKYWGFMVNMWYGLLETSKEINSRLLYSA